MTPDILATLEEYRAARKGRMVNFTFLDDGGVQVSAQNDDKHSWSCGMGNNVAEAFAKAFHAPKTRSPDIRPPMPDRTLLDDEDDEYANLI